MRKPWTPLIVPRGTDQNVYLVVDDLGRLGRVWREADVETTDLETVVRDLLEGQHKDPVRVSEDAAQEIRRRCDLQLTDVPSSIQDFVERHERYDRQQLTLRLV